MLLNTLKVFAVLIFLNLNSCSFRGFKPPPTSRESWFKPYQNTTILDASKKMLECGSPSAIGDRAYPSGRLASFDEISIYFECMLRDGWLYGRTERYNHCTLKAIDPKGKIYTNDADAGCQPNAIIPVPSRERRLNSEFCQTYPKADACQP